MSSIKIIFKTHLDIGFTDLAVSVIQSYLDKHIPEAIKTAVYCRRQLNFQYCWTVGAWLIYEYLECADANARRKLELAIERGDVTWHALPFTTHSEFAGESLFRLGLTLSQKLDRRFGRQTIAAKLTDVPGHTRGIISPLADSGVSFLHIGINPASAAAKVPPLFRWRDSSGKEIIVAYQPDYGAMLPVPGKDTTYLVMVGGDNTGAQSPETVMALLTKLKAEYPRAKIGGATLNDQARELLPLREQLPLLTSEIGDSWIHGIASDPWKVARFRDLCRFRQEDKLENHDAFSRSLLLVAEHTWGLDEKTHFKNRSAWRASELKKIAAEPETLRFAASWQEQRNYLKQAIAALPPDCASRAEARLQCLKVKIPRLALSDRVCYESRYFILEWDTERSCLIRLCHKLSGCELAAADRPLFLLSRESFTAADMERFTRRYLRHRWEWALADFGKPGMPENMPGGVTSGYPGRFGSRYRKGSWHFVAMNQAPLPGVGGFKKVSIELILSDDQPHIEARLQWQGKSADRQPHAVWLEFHPAFNSSFCNFTKLGETIAARDVVSGGGRALHAIDGKITWGSRTGFLALDSLDAPLLAPGRRVLGDFPNRLPNLDEGIAINLYNNLWGTNFPMWFGDDMAFRFELKFGSNEDHPPAQRQNRSNQRCFCPG